MIDFFCFLSSVVIIIFLFLFLVIYACAKVENRGQEEDSQKNEEHTGIWEKWEQGIEREEKEKERRRQEKILLEWEMERERERKEREDTQIKKRQESIDKFNTLISELPKVEVIASDELAEKQNINDLSDLTFSGITKRSVLERFADFVAIDVETTGLKASSCEIIEVAAVRFRDFEPAESFTTLLKSKKPIPEDATEINHITDDMVVEKPYFGQIVESLSEFIGKDNLVGHNLLFDLKFLYKNGYNFLEQKRKYYDTLDLAKRIIDPDYVYDYKLVTLSERNGVYRDDCHRALGDSVAAGYLFIDLAKEKTDEF